jgi:hypothetical protein
MRRLQRGMMLLALPLLALSLVLAGCSQGGKDHSDKRRSRRDRDKGASVSKEKKPIEATGMATLMGQAKLTGGKEYLATLTEKLHATMDKNAGKDYCYSGKDFEKEQQDYYVGKNNNVGYVFVWVEPADSNQFFPVSQEQLDNLPKTVEIQQPHCAFLPHCVVLFSEYTDPNDPKKNKKTGQTFTVKNDATIAHNTGVTGPVNQTPVNKVLQPGEALDPLVLLPERSAVKVYCGVHSWMNAWVKVFDHPYATLTKVPLVMDDKGTITGVKFDADDFGTYKLEVPAGVKLRLKAWHEKAGYLNGSDGEVIELEKGKSLTKNFQLAAEAPK